MALTGASFAQLIGAGSNDHLLRMSLPPNLSAVALIRYRLSQLTPWARLLNGSINL